MSPHSMYQRCCNSRSNHHRTAVAEFGVDCRCCCCSCTVELWASCGRAARNKQSRWLQLTPSMIRQTLSRVYTASDSHIANVLSPVTLSSYDIQFQDVKPPKIEDIQSLNCILLIIHYLFYICINSNCYCLCISLYITVSHCPMCSVINIFSITLCMDIILDVPISYM